MNIDLGELSRAVGRPVATYDVEAIDPHLRIHSVTGGVYRVRGEGFSIVVKVVRHGADGTPDGLWLSAAEPTHRNYWKREWLAFDSGLLGRLPGRLRAPRRLLTTEVSADECWIWMEDARGRHGPSLGLADFAAIAFALGTTQGAYAAGATALPSDEWLSRDWLQGWVDACARMVESLDDETLWRDERLRALGRLRPRVRALWRERSRLLDITDSAPRTLVHWDFWPSNLYVDNDDVIAIDWSQVGLGCVAQDLDQITLDTVWMQVRPEESLDELERRVLPSYAAGLREAGLDVEASQLRRWYAAAAAARYAWMGAGQARILADPAAVAAQERRFGREYDAVLAVKARVVEHAIQLGEWALESGR
ncbi:MAG TPA: hypothetical protein VFH66_00170 [Mycobacteriales bacterium]|nr:hypothetical protein [Mycobacteriales bacterium]